MLGLDGNWYKHQCSTWRSPLNDGIDCGRRNEQVVSQPFLFWFGFSSPPLDKFPFFLLYFPSFLLFFYLFFVFVFLFYLFPFHHLFFFFKFLFRPFLLPFFLLIQFIFLLFLSFYLFFLLFLLFLLEWEKITQKELFSMVTTSVFSNP